MVANFVLFGSGGNSNKEMFGHFVLFKWVNECYKEIIDICIIDYPVTSY